MFEPALASLFSAAAKTDEVRGDRAPYDLLVAIGTLAAMPATIAPHVARACRACRSMGYDLKLPHPDRN